MAERDTIADFDARIAIDKLALDDELVNHANWFIRVADALTDQNARTERAKTERDRVEGELYTEYREEMTGQSRTAKGDPKPPTEAEVRAKIRSDKRYIRADEDFEREKEMSERWATRREAWKDRHKSLDALARLYAADYFQLTADSSRGSPRSSISDRAHEARTDMIKDQHRRRTETEPERPPRRAESAARSGRVDDAPPRRVPLRES